jgi:hypothetical protein
MPLLTLDLESNGILDITRLMESSTDQQCHRLYAEVYDLQKQPSVSSVLHLGSSSLQRSYFSKFVAFCLLKAKDLHPFHYDTTFCLLSFIVTLVSHSSTLAPRSFQWWYRHGGNDRNYPVYMSAQPSTSSGNSLVGSEKPPLICVTVARSWLFCAAPLAKLVPSISALLVRPQPRPQAASESSAGIRKNGPIQTSQHGSVKPVRIPLQCCCIACKRCGVLCFVFASFAFLLRS